MGSVKCNKATVTEADRAARETSREGVSQCLPVVNLVLGVCLCVEVSWIRAQAAGLRRLQTASHSVATVCQVAEADF